jgi:hypothetical protein
LSKKKVQEKCKDLVRIEKKIKKTFDWVNRTKKMQRPS